MSQSRFRSEVYNPFSLHPSRGMAGSGFRPLSKIPHCCRSKASGPCLSPSVADHPLRPTKDLWLGELLIHQLPNPTRAHLLPTVMSFFCFIRDSRALVNRVGHLFSTVVEGRFSRVTHPFATKLGQVGLYQQPFLRSTCMCKAYRQRSF